MSCFTSFASSLLLAFVLVAFLTQASCSALSSVQVRQSWKKTDSNQVRRTKDCLGCFTSPKKRASCKRIVDSCDDIVITHDKPAPTRTLSMVRSGSYDDKVYENVNPNLKSENSSFYCHGFNQLFMVRPTTCVLDIGKGTEITAEGLASELYEALESEESGEFSIVSVSIVTWYDVYGSSRLLDGRRSDADMSAVVAGRATQWDVAAQVTVWSTTSAKAKIVAKAMNKLARQDAWSDSFSTVTSDYSVERDSSNNKKYIVLVPFSEEFLAEFNF